MRDYNEISSLAKVSTNRKLAHEIRGWLVRMSKNLWVPYRCWPRTAPVLRVSVEEGTKEKPESTITA